MHGKKLQLNIEGLNTLKQNIIIASTCFKDVLIPGKDLSDPKKKDGITNRYSQTLYMEAQMYFCRFTSNGLNCSFVHLFR